MSFLNRTIIPTANGLTTLTVPLEGGRENKELLKDVRIDNSQRWQTRHWRTITSAYRRSPWFEFYEPGLAPFYEQHFEKLCDWNKELLSWVFNSLKIKFEIKSPEESPNEEFGRPGIEMKPSNFQEHRFTAGLPVYGQVFQDRIGFQTNMSIIDLLFNEGNNSRSLIVNAST